MGGVIFLDCEASSLHPSLSNPIEIAWGGPVGPIESYLINPFPSQDGWTDWDPQAQTLHGLSQDYLRQNGKLPREVAEAICRSLAGKTVYTDAPEYDGFWIRRLLVAGLGTNSCNIYVDHIDSLLTGILTKDYWELSTDKHGPERHIKALCAQAWRTVISDGLSPHRAGNDLMYLRELYRLASQVGLGY